MSYQVGVSGLRRGLSLARVFALMPDCQVAALCDPDPSALERAGRQFPAARCFGAFSDLLESGIDIAVVASPIPAHREQSTAALEAGCHVLQEVILGATIAECRQLLDAVRAHPRRKFMLAENCCYWAHILSWATMWSEGLLGELLYAECEYIHDVRGLHRNPDGSPTWRSLHYPLTYCTHSLGPVLKITGERCVSACGMATANKMDPERGQYDFGVALFRTTSGAVIKFLRGDQLRRDPAFHYYSLYGTRGCLETSRPPEPLRTNACLEQVPHLQGMIQMPLGYDVPAAPAAAAAGGHGTAEYFMVQDFLDCIRRDAPPPIDIYRGLEMSLPGLCAQESARAGGRPVDVPDWR